MDKKTLILEVQYSDRIDKYISTNSEFSRQKVQLLIENELVKVDQKKVMKANFVVRENQTIEITMPDQKPIKIPSTKMDLDIIYEDDDLIVLNKKSGVVVHPAPGHYDDTLVNGLIYKYKDQLSQVSTLRPGTVHRLDKDTSGLIIFAKNNFAHDSLTNQLKNHSVNRVYLALVEGIIKEDVLHVNLPIGRDTSDRKKMVVTKKNGKESITHVYVKERFLNRTLVECHLETGRTHQIRVHLSYIKHPVINDHVYGINKDKDDSFGQYLHAYKISFIHPISNKKMTFEAPIPKEFEDLLSKERQSKDGK